MDASTDTDGEMAINSDIKNRELYTT
jgi:hypothetical protein